MEVQLDQRNHPDWHASNERWTVDRVAPHIPPNHPRRLPPLLCPLPEQHFPRPVELSFNPVSEDKPSASSRPFDGKRTDSTTSSQPPSSIPSSQLYADSHQHNGKEIGSPRIVPLAATASLSATRKKSAIAHTSLPPLQHTSPPSALQVTAVDESQYFVSTSFASGEKGFNVPTSGTSAQFQVMTIQTEQGPVEVPDDVQSASRVADKKRTRNATASQKSRRRRKEREKDLEAQVQKLTEERDYYQHWCNALALQNDTSMPPPPTFGAQLCQDNKVSAPKQGKKRRTNTYTPPQATPHDINNQHFLGSFYWYA